MSRERRRGSASSKTPPARGAAPAPRPKPRPGGPPVAVLALVVGVVALAAAALWWRGARHGAPGRAAPVAAAPMSDDSIRIVARWLIDANTRQDWPEALRLATKLSRALPRNVVALNQLALAEHNMRNPVPSARMGQRYLLRSSLDYADAERTAIALLDSMRTVAQTPAERARALVYQARVRRFQGLPLETLACCEAALREDPGNADALQAIQETVASLRAAQPPTK